VQGDCLVQRPAVMRSSWSPQPSAAPSQSSALILFETSQQTLEQQVWGRLLPYSGTWTTSHKRVLAGGCSRQGSAAVMKVAEALPP
jgi:hypothetical protein